IFGISKDITVQKETEQELELTNKKLLDASRQAGMAEIATNVIHNVGNVLNSINVSISQTTDISRGLKIDKLKKIADMLQANLDDPKFLTEDEKGKRIPEYLSLFAEELAKDRSMIEKELESTRCHLQHVKMIVSMQQEYATANQVIEEVDLAEVLEDAVKMSSGSLERHRISLVREFDSGIQMMLEKHRVMQILVNLIRNAKHAVQDTEQEERRLTVAVLRPDDQTVTIEISDNGVGISPDNILKLFNHGFSTKSHGHGFGLHSCANSAKELGGSLTAHSEGLGKGATFKLVLPVKPMEMNAVATAPIMHADVDLNSSGSPSAIA
ncbi:ATP-binding protein, partial [Mariniblastus sp.]|nr:ATP-binding protein [Mariniblastus sp.]